MKAPCQISEHGSGFVIRVRGDVQNASGYASVFDRFHSFRQTWAGAGGRRELRLAWRRENRDKQKEKSNEGDLRRVLKMFQAIYFHLAASRGGAANGHSLRSRDCTRKTTNPKTITNNPHQMALPVRRKSHIQPAMVSSAGSGYNHILNGSRSGGQRRRKSITPTAWPMN